MQISNLGEKRLLERISKKIKSGKGVVKGVGDDAAVINYDKKYYMLFTTDSLVEDVHFKRKWFKAEQIGRKAVEVNVSDIAAMGGFPKYCLISLSLPKNLDVMFVDRLYNGVRESANKYKIIIIGGNLSCSKEISITVHIIGFVEKKGLCLRSDAKAGDWICVTGQHGRTAAALHLLYRNKKGPSVKAFLNIKAKLAEARKLSSLGINAMEDNSDTLPLTVKHICEASNAGAIIYKNKIPIAKEAIKDAKKLRKNAKEFALDGDYLELLFTIPKNKLKALNRTGIEFSVIGEIKRKKEGIYLAGDGKKIPLYGGYDHFRGK